MNNSNTKNVFYKSFLIKIKKFTALVNVQSMVYLFLNFLPF